MPQTRQAAKRMRQDRKRALRNKMVKSRLKTLEKKVRSDVEEGSLDKAKSDLRECTSALDSAARKGRTTKNEAGRRKSRLSKLVNQLAAQAASKPSQS